MKKTKNRWLIALSAIFIHLSIGSAYAYSVYKNPISEQLGWSGTQVSLAFTLAIVFLGLAAAIGGKYVEKYGPRKSATVSAILFSLGHIGSGFAISIESLPLFLFMYGVVGGIGLGIGYISPVSTLVKWFPDRRGLATGMAVFGFGAGALITSPIAANLIVSINIQSTFYILGFAYLILMMIGASYIARPEEGWAPKGFNSKEAGGTKIKADLSQLNANEAVKTKRFWLLWTMIFINVSSGIMIISVASPMAQDMVGMSAVAAAAMVGLMGLLNGAGRIVWSSISDFIGRPAVFITYFSIQIVAFAVIPFTTNAILFQLLILIVLTCYGGGFAALPAFIGDLFGTKQLGAIHGYILTAWSLAGVVGPITVSYIREVTNSYIPAFYIFTALLVIALVVSLMMKADIKKVRQQNEISDKKSLVS
ncbi:OFA family oxalate/formate antiporter-like MFS transporter [Bacillus mesophilus]|uniref:OFA family MFS transporter n=1 Tax=Bacillus mesophilus TaxID=1808955 RepID=A0A6M0QBB7_9BACI|nr:OFA family oxalate/formate antiporter-like MFS transporter [Bacillus mesophilus]NEY73625.1 OFA family MFS transporter [Bacillus mesophilus]